MKVFVSAAEISSDIHAEKIIRNLIELYSVDGAQVEVAGIGGPRLRSLPGFRSLQNAEEMRTMGFVEVLGKISFLKKIQGLLLAHLQTETPDLILTFDYPDFHLRLLEQVRLRKIAPRALKICGIPPKVWVWRSHRVEQIRKLYDGVLVVFPFEKNFYQARGIPVIFEGNPLIADLLEATSTKYNEEKSSDRTTITVMPGSRDAELKYHLPLLPPTLELLATKLQHPVKALVPVPRGIDLEKIKSVLKNTPQVSYEFRVDGAQECLSGTSLGLIKSGTATLEAAVLGCVPVIFYKTNKLTEWIFRLFVRYAGPVGLPNILLGASDRDRAPFPEFLGPNATPEKLANELFRLATHTPERILAQKSVAQLKADLVPTSAVAQNIAKKIRAWQMQKPFQFPARHSHFSIRWGSFIWSTINFLRREIFSAEAETFPVPSVLFGNIQAGGTGKTPLLIEFAKYAIEQGKQVAIVSRGYRGNKEGDTTIILPSQKTISPIEYGDEPAEIKKRVPGAYLAIGADRVESVRALLRTAAEKRDAIDLLLFDDGFQNLKFEATVNVLCVTDQSRGEALYRDFSGTLAEADFILGTKGNDFSHYEKIYPKNFRTVEWISPELPTSPVWLFTGVGNPLEVESYYSTLGVKIEKVISKADHAVFEASEVKKLMSEAQAVGAMLAVTEKDFVKLAPLGISPSQVYVLTRQLKSPDCIKMIFEYLQR